VLDTLSRASSITVMVSVVAYLGACLLGLGAGGGVSVALPDPAAGLPVLYRGDARHPDHRAAALCGFRAVAPWWWRGGMRWRNLWAGRVRTRDFPLLWRAVLALVLAYAAFLAEIFRAGLQAVDKGQVEAAQALGLNGWQRFRHIVFPQAFRMILPPLGNDFVAMVKDSSLVSVLGVGDVAQLAKVTAAGNFLYFETYNVAALIYLTMTIGLSLLMRRLEKRLKAREER
jgi:polar amino acid transport system permease protein